MGATGAYPLQGTLDVDFHRGSCAAQRYPQIGGLGTGRLARRHVLWAGNFIIGRAVRGQIDPLELNFWRWSIALAVLLPVTA